MKVQLPNGLIDGSDHFNYVIVDELKGKQQNYLVDRDLIVGNIGHIPKIVEDLHKKYGIEIGYKGRFYGFSGLVFGLSKLRGIESLCLFGKTVPKPEDPEHPDEDSAKTVVEHLTRILGIE